MGFVSSCGECAWCLLLHAGVSLLHAWGCMHGGRCMGRCAACAAAPRRCHPPLTLPKPAERAMNTTCEVGSRPAFLRQGPQLQHCRQPGPQEPRQGGHTQLPLAEARSASSPWRFFRHLWLEGGGVEWGGGVGGSQRRETACSSCHAQHATACSLAAPMQHGAASAAPLAVLGQSAARCQPLWHRQRWCSAVL